MDSKNSVRVRFAPSPTGLLHIGGLRTALYNYLFARSLRGVFILRIEDTDQARFVAEAESDIKSSLDWAGLDWDEGPDKGGAFGPYRQSERVDLYNSVIETLLSGGKAYYAFDTPDDLDKLRQGAMGEVRSYNAASRDLMANSISLSESDCASRIAAGERYVVRLLVEPGQTITFDDAIRGSVSFDSDVIDDQVLLKSDGLPTYHLANIVDDHHMQITHVIRGEEWLSSTPKHMLLYQSLGWTPPTMAHLPLIISPTGGKLSKRNADKMGIPVSVSDYRKSGYEPEALTNFLAMLGWNPGHEQEIFSLSDLVSQFKLEDVGSSGMQFSMKKLEWFNQEWIRNFGEAEITDRLRERKIVDDSTIWQRITPLFQERVTLLADLPTEAAFFFEAPKSFDEKLARKAWKEGTNEILLELVAQFGNASFTSADLKNLIDKFVAERELKYGQVMLPLRVALTGKGGGPSIFEILEVLGKQATIERIDFALRQLG